MNKYIVSYKLFNVPLSYVGVSWHDTALSKPEADRLSKVFDGELPTSTVLYVQGTAAPIVNQLFDKGRKVRGVDLGERLTSPFEVWDNPNADVVLIYGVENPVGNAKITKKIYDDCVNFYKALGALIVVVSSDTSTVFEGNYSVKLTNKLVIKDKPEVKFV